MKEDYKTIILNMNQTGRPKNQNAVLVEIKEKAKRIQQEFKEFSNGYRAIQLILRSADGGHYNNTKVKKCITKNKEEYIEAIENCLAYKYILGLPYRIYASVNERNFKKAERNFKQNLLDNDYADEIVHERFYIDMHNQFVSVMMKPSSKKTSYFIIDVDQKELSPYIEWFEERDLVVKYYRTKNGWHIVTKPFNPSEFKETETAHIQKDSLILLDY